MSKFKIKISFSRDENKNYYNADTAEIDLDEYARGVCASEMGNAEIEALKAQAVAARTNAYVYVKSGKSISDLSSKVQAFRASRLSDSYQNAKAAAVETSDIVLYCDGKLANPASFSSGNCGHTRSSKERWGTEVKWLQSFEDPYDTATVKAHSVGMSQSGLRAMAKLGMSFMDMLSFYYPHTYLHNIATGEDIYCNKKEDGFMATIKASDLVKIFKQAADEHWPYISGGASYKSVDCSGLFTYAFDKLGGFMYHGSNTIWRKYTTEKGRIGEINLVPGMAVFVHKDDGQEPDQYRNDGQGDFSHIGLYVGDGKVVEAKGTKYGTVYSEVSEKKWTYAARLKGVDYNVQDGADNKEGSASPSSYPIAGTVHLTSGYLNVRSGPSTATSVIGKVVNGEEVTLTNKVGNFYAITTKSDVKGYCSCDYITPGRQTVDYSNIIVTIFNASILDKTNIEAYLNNLGLKYGIREGED